MTTRRSSREVEQDPSAAPGTAQAGRKEQHWHHHLRAWTSSGLSQAEYCRRNQLSWRCFGYWKRKAARPAPSMKLLPIALRPLSEASSGLTLVLGDRYRVEVGDGFNPETFERLLSLLARI